MTNIFERIEKAIESEAMKFGIMGTEPVMVTIAITEKEHEEFIKSKLDCRYYWEIEGGNLHITYTDDHPQYILEKIANSKTSSELSDIIENLLSSICEADNAASETWEETLSRLQDENRETAAQETLKIAINKWHEIEKQG